MCSYCLLFGKITFTGFVSGLKNDVDCSRDMRCEYSSLDLVDYFSLVMERGNLKYGNGIPRLYERLRQPIRVLL